MNDNTKPENFYRDNQIIDEDHNILKIVGISSLFGLFFGILALLIIYIKGDFEGGLTYFIPVFCGLLAGMAGFIGDFLKKQLKKRGIKSRLKRSMISFIIILVMTLIITGVVFLKNNNTTFFNQLSHKMIWGILIGCIFGVVITLAEYYNWKMNQKMLILEMKNKHLKEIAEKDSILKETIKNLLVARERNMMARELHDSISQGIHGITFGIDSLRQQLNKLDIKEEKLNEIVDHLDTTAAGTLQELRHMIAELKPALLEKNSLKEALLIHCDLFSKRQQIEVIQEIDDIESLSPEQELSIFRIVQEALANIQKHAQADRVEVFLKIDQQDEENKVLLIIKDNGSGFKEENIIRGNGLNNMEFRSRQAGGKFNIKTAPGKGTKIKVRFHPTG